MWAIEDSPGPKVAYRGGGIILLLAILLYQKLQFASLYALYLGMCQNHSKNWQQDNNHGWVL